MLKFMVLLALASLWYLKSTTLPRLYFYDYTIETSHTAKFAAHIDDIKINVVFIKIGSTIAKLQ